MSSVVVRFSIALWVASGLLGSAAVAGEVWVVDDDGGAGVDFADLQMAVDAAGAGDVILVQSGDYGSLSIEGVGLTVVAEADGVVRVAAPWTVSGIGADEQVVLRGLELGAPLPGGVEIVACDGDVWLEDCRLVASPSTQGSVDAVRVEQSARVVLARCSIEAGASLTVGLFEAPADGGNAVHARDSRLAVLECDLVGGDGGHAAAESSAAGAEGGSGLRLVSSVAYVAGGSAIGGMGGQGGQVWVPPLGPFECGDGGSGGAGVRTVAATAVPFPESGSELTLRDCATGSAAGGASPCAAPGPSGNPLSIEPGAPHQVEELDHAARGFSVSSPVRGGTNARLEFAGEFGDVVFALVAQGGSWLELDGQPVPLLIGDALGLLGPWTIPVAGVTVQPIPIPLQAATFSGVTVALQAVVVEVESGALTLAPCSTLTLLHQAL